MTRDGTMKMGKQESEKVRKRKRERKKEREKMKGERQGERERPCQSVVSSLVTIDSRHYC